MWRQLALAGLVIVGVPGCAPMKPMAVSVAFDPQAGAWIMERGTGSITGQAFLRQKGGGVVTCAGAVVEALPVTAYSTERMRLLYNSTERGYRDNTYSYFAPVESPPDEYVRQQRTGQCDAQGRFRIIDLPAGDYYLLTQVLWSVGYSREGGFLMRRVSVGPGQNVELILTHP